MIDLAIDATRAIVYFSNGYMHKKYLYLLPILFVVSIIGNFIGKKILTKISEVQFKIIVLILIFITGIITLYKSIIP
jgi:uncharacterized membrane protein YfcA